MYICCNLRFSDCFYIRLPFSLQERCEALKEDSKNSAHLLWTDWNEALIRPKSVSHWITFCTTVIFLSEMCLNVTFFFLVFVGLNDLVDKGIIVHCEFDAYTIKLKVHDHTLCLLSFILFGSTVFEPLKPSSWLHRPSNSAKLKACYNWGFLAS